MSELREAVFRMQRTERVFHGIMMVHRRWYSCRLRYGGCMRPLRALSRMVWGREDYTHAEIR